MLTSTEVIHALNSQQVGQYIEKPVWVYVKEGEGPLESQEKNTLRPDCLRMKKGKEGYFDIIDAKYYLIKTDGVKLSGNPGVGDVTKQFLYDYEYRPLVEKNEIPYDKVSNVFLMPGSIINHAENFGQVQMPWLQKLGGEPTKLSDIQVWKINARWLLSTYNTGKEFLDEGKPILDWLNAENGKKEYDV